MGEQVIYFLTGYMISGVVLIFNLLSKNKEIKQLEAQIEDLVEASDLDRRVSDAIISLEMQNSLSLREELIMRISINNKILDFKTFVNEQGLDTTKGVESIKKYVRDLETEVMQNHNYREMKSNEKTI